MKSGYPLYEGDGIIHKSSEETVVASCGAEKSASGPNAHLAAYLSLSDLEKSARQSRSQALASLIARFLDWIDAGIQRAKYRDLESYLAKSTDLADLEHRMRRMEGEPRNMLPA